MAAGRFPSSSTITAPAGVASGESVPFEHVGALLTRAGHAVLVPERRGYGRSGGASVAVKPSARTGG